MCQDTSPQQRTPLVTQPETRPPRSAQPGQGAIDFPTVSCKGWGWGHLKVGSDPEPLTTPGTKVTGGTDVDSETETEALRVRSQTN